MPDLRSVIRGRVWKFGDSVDTNQLAGGGVRVSEDPNENLRANCLRGIRPEFPEQARTGDILIAGRNFGCGSHRQTAVEAIQLCGIAAVLAESVARIHMRNSIACALPTYVVPGISEFARDGSEIEVDYAKGEVRDPESGARLTFQQFPDAVEQIYDAGGIYQVIAARLAAEGILPDA